MNSFYMQIRDVAVRKVLKVIGYRRNKSKSQSDF